MSVFEDGLMLAIDSQRVPTLELRDELGGSVEDVRRRVPDCEGKGIVNNEEVA
jgi:DNA-binding Lrp family transcriptional regulator